MRRESNSSDPTRETSPRPRPRTLPERLRAWAAAAPDRLVYTFLQDGEDQELHLTYGELDRRARDVAARLQYLGLGGERVLLLFPPGLDYAAGFLGCLYAGAIAVPAYPPTGSRGIPRLLSILADCEPRAVLSVAALRGSIERQLAKADRGLDLPFLDVDADPERETANAARWRDPGIGPDDLAFLQYTSGSTSTPKGVMVSHGNLVANQAMIQEAFATSEETEVVVSWLPLYHDMGLIGGLLHPLYLGGRCVLLSPIHFLQRPARWLRAISRYKATISGGPNFAYELCSRKLAPEEIAELDLSSWKVAFNGAEPVRAEVLDRFAETFAPAGFRRASHFPCYGLAEATLLVSGKRLDAEADGPAVVTADAAALAAGQVQTPESHEAPARRLVGCGGIPAGIDVRVVDPAALAECAPGAVGEIWVAGAAVAHGYWKRPDASAETFGAHLADGRGPYLRTGDLGFLADGELLGDLFITGRIKDLILIRGRNLYPQDIEWTVERSHPALRAGGGAAFTVDEGGEGGAGSEERLVVVQEISPKATELEAVAAAIRQAVAEEHETTVSAVVLVKPGGVPKTTSGKIQRRACRELFLSGGLDPLGEWREGEGTAGGRERVAPRTPAEERLAAIWEDVLGLPAGTVGAEDNFFALGGDSLRGSQLLARLEERAGAGLTLDELFAAPTLAELAARLEGVLTAEAPRAALPRADRTAPLPLTSPQRRLWFLDQVEPGNPAYNLAFSARLSGRLDISALAAALNEVERRHEALRTVFRAEGGVLSQIVQSPAGVPLPVIDLSDQPDPERARAELEREGARRAFDLAHGPLLAARLARLGPAEHELQVTVHHIVSDGWSIGVLLREIAALYEAFAAGQPSPLPELPVQLGDFAVFEAAHEQSEAMAGRLATWRRRLGGTLPVLDLPADRARPPVPSYRGAHAVHVFPPAVERGLRAFAGAHGASLFMALLAGFQTLLHRVTAQDDLIVGTAVANRDRVELEGLVGLFVNTLALRTDLSGDPSFVDLLGRARATALEALAGRDVPFERLVDELAPQRDLSVMPIVQVMLVLQNAPLAAAPPAGLGLSAREVDNGTARFDLALSVIETDEGLTAVYKHSRDLFDPATIDRLAGAFETLLAAAVAEPGRRLSELPLLNPAQRQQVVREWNATAVPGLDSGLLHEAVEAQVDRTPDGVAVVYDLDSFTYRELDRRANQLAHHLRKLGVRPEALVGVAVERSLELEVALLGVLKAGAAYLPLDPSYPADRLGYMIEDARVPVLLTLERLRANLPESAAKVVCLDADWPAIAAESGARPAVPLQPESLAYCIYTSGSTGRPKGALIPHRGIVNRLRWMQAEYGLVPGEGVLQKTPASFDVSVWEFFWPLMAGARLVFARPGGHQDSAYLAGLIAAQGITTLHFVPSMLQVFLEEPRLRDCTGLRRVIASGEALPRELEERFFVLLPATGLHNLYGPTEASVDVTSWACRRDETRAGVPIGRPISNIQIHLLDRGGNPVPIGVPGHLHIGGVGLARGYLRRPELTAERFVPDPLGPPGARLYATGDLARLRPDGAIEFLGRLDHQVKIRGFRIELGEIESAINAHPAVRESVVMAREIWSARGARGHSTGRRLVAYVVGHGNALSREQIDDLRASLAARLPEHMVPASFVTLDAFPLNPSGKVDRKALPAPEEDRREEESWPIEVAPRTPLEAKVAALWAEQLGASRVGVNDSFFALGGDSIQGALFINRLQKELDAIVYVMALFDHPTVAKFAAFLEESYRDALAAAGWIEEAGHGADEGDPDARDEAADLAALAGYVASRFSPAEPPPRPSPALTRGRGRHHPPLEETGPEAEGGGALSRVAGEGWGGGPPPLFLLSPFRSGSTLLRVMLAGHPALFAPPELELLGFHTMGERRRTFEGRDRFSREGLLRAVMELRGCSAEEAEALAGEAEARDEPVPAFYARLQSWAAGRRLVDKTPRYGLDHATLERAERWFGEPLYIHLMRHPAGTVHSYLEARMHEVYRIPLPHRRQAELVWRRTHENILEHLANVPAERQHRLRFEDLVQDPRGTMEALCRFLGIDFDPAMLSPYEGERMTDGLHGAGRMMGDPKFHSHKGIEAGAAERWRQAGGIRLSEPTWRLAEKLGYPRPRPIAALEIPRVPRVAAAQPVLTEIDLPLSFGQQRLWFLDRLEPGSSAYNMPAAVRLTGALDVDALARACVEIERRHEVLRTVFPAVSGKPRQAVREPGPVLHEVVDLSGMDEAVRRAEVERQIAEEAERPFDLAAGPLWRVRLLRLGSLENAEHVLLVNLHHIVCDGWSVGILTRELAVLYDAFRKGAPSPLPEPALQYADFAAWQRQRLSGDFLEELLRYWRERLAPPLPVLELPLDRPRPAVQTFRGARLPLAVPPDLAAALRALGQEEGATLFMVLVAAFDTLLYRYSGQDDLLLGTPVANRNRAEIEGLIGLFVNTRVLRADLSGDPGFRELLGRVRQVCLGAARHEEMPFEKLVESLGVERALGRSPLFSVFLALQNAPPAQLALPGLTLERLEVATRTAKFELTLDLAERPDGGLSGSLEYNADLFDESTAARFARHFANLLAGAVAPRRGDLPRLADLPLLSDAERAELVAASNDTRADFPAEATVFDLFAATARRVPERVAVSREGRRLLYGELAERAGRLARRLAGLGVGPEVLVGVCAERSPDLLVGLLAVLQAGGAYVPLDPTHPKDRLGYILADSGAPVLVTERHLLEVLPEHGARVVFLDDAEPGPGEALAAPRQADPENLAYTIYTSGSTGRPKGVGVRHRGVVNYLTTMARRPGLAEGDVILGVTTLSFDIAVTELFLPLAVGARVELVSRDTASDAARLAAALEAAGATCMQATPATWTLLVNGGWPGRPGLKALCGGEALPRPLADRLLPRVDSLWNVYGPTETTVWSTLHRVEPGDGPVPVGKPIGNTTVHLLGRYGELAQPGAAGELVIGGAGLARGYHGRPDLTAERFVPDPFGGLSGQGGDRLYRTGDLARRLAGGDIEYLGRFDHQVKIRGFRIEIGEIEAVLLEHPGIREAVVVAAGDAGGDRRLVAYVARAAGSDLPWEELRSYLATRLPLYMVPAVAVFLDRLPLLPSGKVDRKSLPDPGRDRPDLAASYVSPQGELERAIAEIWQEVLGLDRVGVQDNFFDLGGHSLLAAEVHGKLRERLGADLTLIELFRFPTVRGLAEYLAGTQGAERTQGTARTARTKAENEEIAIVGMAGRFPGASDLGSLWRNLRDGVESISTFSDAELLAAAVDPALLANPRYVRARGVLDGVEMFDAPFFGYSPREATITDPQQRVFLECAWEALESAGLDPETWPGRIGVYAGSVFSTYLLFHLLPGMAPEDGWQIVTANDKDTLCTRLSYKLNLRGPSVAVQTACSTALVAVHMARQSLLDGECDVALAGGVSIRSPQTTGYLYQEESILSPDGHCRAFDARARGTVFSSGAGIVVLKRLSDALADGDTIHAVIKGSAINNDGSGKIGFTAPSVDGQSEVVARALEAAGVDPASVSYVEAHGTGTAIGDPIEVAGLTRAFRQAGAAESGFCALGSVKTNFGHLDSAAGVAGLIKTVLALEHRQIPPTLHYESPNPQIDFAASPFYVADRLLPWETEARPRRAGVSSLGIGGTNAHVVLEEAPAPLPISEAKPWQLLVLSAKTETALDAAAERLTGFLSGSEIPELADIAFTLQAGRRAFPWRRAVVCRDRDDALAALADPDRILAAPPAEGRPEVAFLFPGQGSQRIDMGRGLYESEPLFRAEVDRCAEILRPHLGEDLRGLLFPAPERRDEAEARLARTSITQPALFVIETALARLWMSWGVRPRAMLGHSVGEYVAAHLAGVMSLEDALALVAARGRLIEELPGGAMLAVPLPEAEVAPRLGPDLSLAAVNGPAQTVVSGTEEGIEALRSELAARGVEGRRLATSHAFHSRQMEPVLDAFTRRVSEVALRAPEIPFLSNVTGRWITADEATDPAYWARHLRQTVRFADGLAALLAEPGLALLEVGPGRSLTRLARRQAGPGSVSVASLDLSGDRPEPAALLDALGRLWTAGVPVDWAGFHAGERRRRVPLPTYPFERRRYWVEPGRAALGTVKPAASPDPASWFHLPAWRRSLPPDAQTVDGGDWLVVLDSCGLGADLADRLDRVGADVIRLNPEEVGDLPALLANLVEAGRRPNRVLHFGALAPAGLEGGGALSREAGEGRGGGLQEEMTRGLDSLTALTRAFEEAGLGEGVTITAVSNGVQRVTGQEDLVPARATLLGWARTAGVARRRSIDIALPPRGTARWERLLDRLITESIAEAGTASEPEVAWRGEDRWVPALEPAPLPRPERPAAWLRPGGAYLVTGGLDGLAFETARRLATAARVRLALTVPPGAEPHPDRLLALTELGTEVQVFSVDLADREVMSVVLERIETAWGPLHGVLYLPSIPVLPGQAEGPAEWMRGAEVLDELLGDDRPLDFLALFSWLEPPAAVRGRADLRAACAFLDALAQRRAARGAAPAVAIDWTPGVGFGTDAAFEVFDRILARHPAPQVAVIASPGVAGHLEEPEVRPVRAIRRSGEDDIPAEDMVALRIAEIWREVLGVERIGLSDRFFDLGGDSLIALQVMARLRDSFPVELPVRTLFERPSVAELRDALEEALTAKLEALSEEEAERLAASFLG